ncbi:MAG: 4Fe-4S binding protein, partial [Candidatus Eisenbacteria bacterium]|nr:4Fe-4S binding protein [Candidatus Latescibacterota bacterium]MBD3301355.1 4Fe-4S binding protein [Candidatus Eisenbacteria bacterium]
MNRRAKARRLIWARRIVQAATLALFVLLLLSTRASDPPADRGWITLFFAIDPLVLLATFLATHTVAGLSLLALVTVGVTLILGRVFCGWICPFGTLHNAASWVRSRRSGKRRLLHAFSRWQRAKFLLLFGLVVMAILGVHWIGVFDPASVLYRSLATAFLPSIHQGIESGATAVYQNDPRIGPLPLTAITEPIYEFFRDRVFVVPSPAFVGAGIILFVFLAALILNLVRPRFWCRYVCPLGALLGLCAKRSSLRLVATENECTSCNLCTIACPAAAQPEKPGEWLPTECFGCWNCVAA